jgi:hypothetical protein
MAATRPNRGPIATTGSPIHVGRAGRTSDGTWRPDLEFSSAAGLKITMRRAPHLTPDGVLRVPLRFQVPVLNDLRRPYRFNWSTFDTVSGGQHSRPMGAQLLDISIDTMLLDVVAANASEGVVVWDGPADPERMLEELRFIQGTDDPRKGKAAPFRLTISQPSVWRSPLVNMIATLTSVEPSMPAGEPGTMYLAAAFLQYDEMAAGQQRRHESPVRRHHLDLGHDTLYSLATRYIHQASAWRQIANANGIKGVSPGSAAELQTWAKRHHKTTVIIPRVELVARIVGEPIANIPGGAA